MTMASFTINIPKIDLESWLNGSPEQRTRVEKEFRQICHEIGFFYLINHGVENEFLEKHMKVIQDFFDLPQAQFFRYCKITLGKRHWSAGGKLSILAWRRRT